MLKAPYILLVYNLIFFYSLSFKVPLKIQVHLEKKKTFESLFGKEKFGRVCCYRRTMTPTTLKKNQEIDALKVEHVIERNYMIKKFEGLEAVMKFVLKQNIDLDENDTKEMMARTLGIESSVIAPPSSVATPVPNDDDE